VASAVSTAGLVGSGAEQAARLASKAETRPRVLIGVIMHPFVGKGSVE